MSEAILDAIPASEHPLVGPGWELLLVVGGRHDGTRFWSHRPPRRFRVVPEGEVYERREEGVWVAEGHAYTPAPVSDDQMRLA